MEICRIDTEAKEPNSTPATIQVVGNGTGPYLRAGAPHSSPMFAASQ
jgi:hypothetical protein